MTPVVVPKIKEKSFLISPDHFWDPQVPNFILSWQINRPVHIQFRRGSRLSTMTRYETSTNIIRKSNQLLRGFRILLLWNTNNRWVLTQKKTTRKILAAKQKNNCLFAKERNLIGQKEKPWGFINLCQNVPECCPPFIPATSCRNNYSATVSADRSFRHLQKIN
jgi:hypothetical protein